MKETKKTELRRPLKNKSRETNCQHRKTTGNPTPSRKRTKGGEKKKQTAPVTKD